MFGVNSRRDRDMRSSRYESTTGTHTIFVENTLETLEVPITNTNKWVKVEDVSRSRSQQSPFGSRCQRRERAPLGRARSDPLRLMRAINRGFVWPSGRQTKHWKAEAQSGGAVIARCIAEVAAAPASNSEYLWETTRNYTMRNYEELRGIVERTGQAAAGASLEGALVRTCERHTSMWRNRRSSRDRSHFKALLWSCASERDTTSLALAHAHAKLKAGHSLPQCALRVPLKWIPVCYSIPTAPSSSSASKGAVRKCIRNMSYEIYL